MARLTPALLVALLTLTWVTSLGCTSSISQHALKRELTQASKAMKGRQAIRRVVPVWYETKMEAWTYLAEARSEPDSSTQSKQLAAGFAMGHKRYVDYVIGGPYTDLTEQIVLNGLNANAGKSLAGLRVLLVTPDEPSDELAAAAKAARVGLYHKPLSTAQK